MSTPRFLLVGLLLSLTPAPWLLAQRAFQIGNQAEPPAPVSTSPRLETLGSTARRTLTQFDALVAPAGESDDADTGELAPIDWDEPLELIENLLADTGNEVVEDPSEPGRFGSVREHCHARIAGLPSEGRQAYRDRVDPAARRLYEQGRNDQNPSALHRVVAEYFCSSWGDDALLLLGDRALERGDTTAAARYWRQISPTISDPQGRPLAWSLIDVDLEQHGSQAAEIIRSARGVGLVHPDADVPIGDLLARLAVAELYDRNLAAAKTYAQLLEQFAPEAIGNLAGRRGPLVELVSALLAEAKDWPTPQAARVGDLYGRMWQKPVTLPVAQQRPPNPRRLIIGGRLRFTPAAGPAVAGPSCVPTVATGVVVYRDGLNINAVNLLTGEPTLGPNGVLFKAINEHPANNANDANQNALNRRIILRQTASIRSGLPADEPFSVRGDQLLARVVTPPTAGGTKEMIRGFDLSREGLPSPIVEPLTGPWKLGGTPLPGRHCVYCPLVADEVTPRVGLAAFSMDSGRELWRTSIATGAAEATHTAPRAPKVMPTLAGDTLYLNTNLGAIAAVDTRTGDLRWVRLYDRVVTASAFGAASRRSGYAPCRVAKGRVFVAPLDSDRVFALDAATGRLLWATDPIEGDCQLLGVHQDTLILSGDQARGLSIDNGAARYTWPESRKAGIRGLGQGCLVGGELFWPTRNRVIVFDAATGTQSRPSIDIADLGGGGANLIPAGQLLIAAGTKAMTCFGPVHREQKTTQPLLSQLSLEPQMHTDKRR